MTEYLLYEISRWWNYPLLISFLILALLYLFFTRNYSTGKKRFLLGIILIALCFGSPIYGIGHLLFSVHMGQMAVLFFFVPPLLLSGVPGELIKKWSRVDFMNSFVFLFKHPMIIMLIFSGLFAIYHIPIVFDTVMTNSILYVGYHVIMMFTAIGMWIPLLSPLSEFFPEIKRKKYLRWSSMIILPACLLLVFAVSPLYQTFHDPKTWQATLDACFGLDHLESMKDAMGLLPTMTDQRLGGVIMLALHKLSHLDMGGKGILK